MFPALIWKTHRSLHTTYIALKDIVGKQLKGYIFKNQRAILAENMEKNFRNFETVFPFPPPNKAIFLAFCYNEQKIKHHFDKNIPCFFPIYETVYLSPIKNNKVWMETGAVFNFLKNWTKKIHIYWVF